METVQSITAIPGKETGIEGIQAEIEDQINPPPQRRGGNDTRGVLNPLDRYGNITRCRTRDSKISLAKRMSCSFKIGPENNVFPFVGEMLN